MDFSCRKSKGLNVSHFFHLELLKAFWIKDCLQSFSSFFSVHTLLKTQNVSLLSANCEELMCVRCLRIWFCYRYLLSVGVKPTRKTTVRELGSQNFHRIVYIFNQINTDWVENVSICQPFEVQGTCPSQMLSRSSWMQTSTNKSRQNYNFVKNLQGLLCFSGTGEKAGGGDNKKTPTTRIHSSKYFHIETQTRM